MPDINSLYQRIFSVNSLTFDGLALEIFEFQYRLNSVYRAFSTALGKKPDNVTHVNDIPFLPIEFFKTKNVKSGEWDAIQVFESSGTTNQTTSKHEVRDVNFYLRNSLSGFEESYGPIEGFAVLALLPSYLERGNSGLITMADFFIKKSNTPESGFYLNEHEQLKQHLEKLKEGGKKTLLLGVTFGLLDFAENFKVDFPELIVMETGGMKGKREEMIRKDVHSILKDTFGVNAIHSEYGMTELFSQAYSKGEGIFTPMRTMKVMARDLNDPLHYPLKERNGGLNIIDLANFNTCAFIETKDLGMVNEDGSFEVKGRIDNSEVRGCNLMVY